MVGWSYLDHHYLCVGVRGAINANPGIGAARAVLRSFEQALGQPAPVYQS